MAGRSKSIDILRAVAVFLVLGMHTEMCPPGAPEFVRVVVAALGTGGWVGVDLFFVLSGFLVSGLLFREHQLSGSISFARFFIRRGMKIYPAFWVFIGTTVMLRLLHHAEIPRGGLAAELLFVQNYWPGLWTHTWSLAVEEHFYLLLPLCLVLLVKLPVRRDDPFRLVCLVFAILAPLCLLLRIATHLSLPEFSHKTHHFPTHLRIDSLFFGVILSYFYHYYPLQFRRLSRRFSGLLLVLGVALLTPPFLYSHRLTPFIYTFGFTLLYLGSGMILASFVACETPVNWFTRTVSYIGAHSYSIYLWHTFIAYEVTAVAGRIMGSNGNWYVYAACYWTGAVLFGIAMSLLVEYPFLRFRDRIFPSLSVGKAGGVTPPPK